MAGKEHGFEKDFLEGPIKFREKKKWKNRWCVLRRPSPVADCLTLQLYKDLKEKQKGAPTKASLALDKLLALQTGHNLDKESFTLSIICQDMVVTVALENRETMLEWQAYVYTILGEVQEHSVQIVHAPSASKVPVGPAHLCIRDYKFCLTQGVPPKLMGYWLFSNLRRYGPLDANKFCWEGGSECRSTSGEGLFILSTGQGSQLSQNFNLAAKGKLDTRKKPSVTSPLLGIRSPRSQPRSRLGSQESRCSRRSEKNFTASSTGDALTTTVDIETVSLSRHSSISVLNHSRQSSLIQITAHPPPPPGAESHYDQPKCVIQAMNLPVSQPSPRHSIHSRPPSTIPDASYYDTPRKMKEVSVNWEKVSQELRRVDNIYEDPPVSQPSHVYEECSAVTDDASGKTLRGKEHIYEELKFREAAAGTSHYHHHHHHQDDITATAKPLPVYAVVNKPKKTLMDRVTLETRPESRSRYRPVENAQPSDDYMHMQALPFSPRTLLQQSQKSLRSNSISHTQPVLDVHPRRCSSADGRRSMNSSHEELLCLEPASCCSHRSSSVSLPRKAPPPPRAIVHKPQPVYQTPSSIRCVPSFGHSCNSKNAMNSVQLRRSISMPCRKANRDSSDSSDSGVSTGDFSPSPYNLAPYWRHWSLPRSSNLNKPTMITTATAAPAGDQLTSFRAIAVPWQKPGSDVSEPCVQTMLSPAQKLPSYSESSGTCDLLDFMESLSVTSSMSSFDILTPRIGEEHIKM